jgi:D-sedoheptulose 7-phosphate isomerase
MSFAEQYRSRLIETLNQIDVSKVAHAIDWLREARDQGRTVFVCGNGGSAATASHFVCDMLKGASYGREKRFKIIALNDSLPTLTAYSNDVSYDHAFVEQLKNFAAPGDVVMALSGSGNSANVLHAIEYGNSIGCRTIALSGRGGGKLGPLAHLDMQVQEGHMGRIEDAHMAICHMICYYFMEQESRRDSAPQEPLLRSAAD